MPPPIYLYNDWCKTVYGARNIFFISMVAQEINLFKVRWSARKTFEGNEPMFRHLLVFKSKTVSINIFTNSILSFPRTLLLNWQVSHDRREKKLALTSVDILEPFNTQSEGHLWYKSAVPRRNRKPSSIRARYIIKGQRYRLLWTNPAFSHSRIRLLLFFLQAFVAHYFLCRVPVYRCLNEADSKLPINGSLRHATNARKKETMMYADKIKNEIDRSCSKHRNCEKCTDKTLLIGRNEGNTWGSHGVNYVV
jgi:hypothetical protein